MEPRGKRAGISELTATVLLIVVTLIAGAALFGYVNGQAASSENALGGQNAGNINYLNERESISLVNFPGGAGSSQVNIWIYNKGGIELSGFFLLISDPALTISCPAPTGAATTATCPPPASCTSATLSGPSSIPTQALQEYSIVLGGCSFQSGPYTVTFQGYYGSFTSATEGV